MPRRYELKERARAQEATRQRIVDATVALHQEVGPARTTIAEIARRAGVGRVTVYNHFPDESALLGACSAQWAAENPPPDPAAWAAIENPAKRLRKALAELYAFFARNEEMLANVTRDAPLVPALAEAMREQGAGAHERAMREALLSGRPVKGGRGRRSRAAVGLAVSFTTWQHLTREEGLESSDAVKLMVRAIEAP
jgi:AcrR family transcriptional regulator